MRASDRTRTLLRWLPEALLLLAFAYFALRRLGTFPAVWADDGLFMIVAKMIAQGRGYVLPILGWDWARPYILAVGPTLLFPVAFAVRWGGFSAEIARLPMALYLLAACVAAYVFVARTSGRGAARWSLALMISFSAFINTGKPVLGEVPAFFFLLGGLLMLRRKERSTLSALVAGAACGLAVVTKLSFGLVLPALGAAWLLAALRRDRGEVAFLTVVLVSAVVVLSVGAYWMGAFERGFYEELRLFLFEKRAVVPLDHFAPIIARPGDLLRLAYAHYALMLALGGFGWWHLRARLAASLSVVILALVFLFALYFLNGPGWYRVLLPATLLLLLFVPVGARVLCGKIGSVALLSALVLTQTYWQYVGGGASASTEAEDAARALVAGWRDRDLVILPPEVFVRLPENPRWLFLSEELRDPERQPEELKRRLERTRCVPVFRRESREDLEGKEGTYRTVSGRYVVLDPPSDCAP